MMLYVQQVQFVHVNSPFKLLLYFNMTSYILKTSSVTVPMSFDPTTPSASGQVLINDTITVVERTAV